MGLQRITLKPNFSATLDELYQNIRFTFLNALSQQSKLQETKQKPS